MAKSNEIKRTYGSFLRARSQGLMTAADAKQALESLNKARVTAGKKEIKPNPIDSLFEFWLLIHGK